MELKTKKLIARQGLAFLIFLAGIVFLLSADYYSRCYNGIKPWRQEAYQTYQSMLRSGKDASLDYVNYYGNLMSSYANMKMVFYRLGKWSLIIYAVYLLASFIIWAIRTLRAK